MQPFPPLKSPVVPGAARVVQAYFPGGSVPAKLGIAQRSLSPRRE